MDRLKVLKKNFYLKNTIIKEHFESDSLSKKFEMAKMKEVP